MLRERIINIMIELAIKYGYQNVTRKMIADTIRISESLINYHFNTIDNLRTYMLQEAIANKQLTVIAQAIVANHPIADKLPLNLRRKALLSYA